MKSLRPYQDAAITSLFAWFASGNTGHPLVVAPVGAGKSLLIAEFIKRVHKTAPRTRIVVIAHVKELLTQNFDELREQYPTVDAGFYCAGLGQKRLHNDVTFASIQSVWNKASSFNRAPQIILIDECHLISHNDATQYRKFIDACLLLNPDCKVVGYTGTPFRADTGRLDEGEGKLFDGVAYQIEMAYMVQEGYWARPFTPKTETRLSVEGVPVRCGDYVAKQLEQAVDVDEKTKACVAEIVGHGAGRRRWLIFTAGIQHCEHVRDAIRSCDISCEMVTGETPQAERDDIIAKYKAGDIRALVNVAVLTTGFNTPDIDMLVFMRPTRSPVLYVQCSGRGVRPVYADGFDLNARQGRLDAIAASTKKDCMILDFGGVIDTLGPIDAVDIRRTGKREGETEPLQQATFKICPSCGTECAPAQKFCYSCSYSFAAASVNTKAGSSAVLSNDVEPETHAVWHVDYKLHEKRDNPDAAPTMRVTYATNNGSFSEWICFEHHGFARQRAEQWHKIRLPLFIPPLTVAEALGLPYPTPATITVRKEGKYDRILSYEFNEDAEPIMPTQHAFKDAQTINLDDEIPF